MKKIYVLLVFLFAFFAFSFIPVKADGPVVTLTNGASVRTEDPVGLKFEATITGDFEGSTIKYGFILSKGSYTLEQMKTNFDRGKATFVDCGVPNGESKFFVTIIGIPESGYTGDITAVALVNIDGEKTYSNISVTRNIAEVAAVSKALGVTGDIIDDVNAYVGSNYKIKNINSLNQVVLSDIDTNVYKYDQINALWSDFITDYNAATGASLTISTTQSEFVTSFSNNIANNDVVTFPSTNNAVKFFDGINLVKWGWLLKYFEEFGATHVGNQANGLLRFDRTVQSYGKGYKLYHLANSIYNLFTKGTDEGPGGFPAVSKFGTESAYTNVWNTIKTYLANNNSELVAIGANITLPTALSASDGYSWDGYYLDSVKYNAESIYEVTSSSVIFEPRFSTISYSINYETYGGSYGANPTSYNVETATFALIDGTKADYDFGGWYRNSSFTGEPVTSIPKGSTGDIDLYAKWLDPVPVELDIDSYNAANKTVLNSVTPDILVIPGISAGRYNLINTSNDTLAAITFTTGVNLFTTISAALTAASENDTIYVFTGEYSDAVTITTDGLTIIGADKGITLTHNSSYTKGGVSHTLISGNITISANSTTIQGVEVSGEITFSSGKSTTLLEEIILTNGTSSQCINVPSGYTTEDLTINKLYVKGNASRQIRIYGSVTNLTITNCVVLDGVTGIYDFTRVDNTGRVYGNLVFENNYISNAQQTAYMDRCPNADNYSITGNYFKDCKTPIFIRETQDAKAGSVFNIRYNAFNGCGGSNWDVIGLYLSQTKTVYVNYNTFANSLAAGSDYSINMKYATGTINCANNYFVASADDHTQNATGKTNWDISGCSLTTPNEYDLYQVVNDGGVYKVNLYNPAS